jgi:hypothetical protein
VIQRAGCPHFVYKWYDFNTVYEWDLPPSVLCVWSKYMRFHNDPRGGRIKEKIETNNSKYKTAKRTYKVKAISVTGSQTAESMSALYIGRPPLPHEISRYSLPSEAESTQGSKCGWKNYVNWLRKLSGNRTRNLQACSIVPQLTTTPRAPKYKTIQEQNGNYY